MSAIALSFDDGPDPVWTPQILDLLAGHGAGATFFPISDRAEQHPGMVERMLAEGHSVGLHCREHVRHRERDADWLRRDTDAAMVTLVRLGADPVLWRAPWGETAPWTEEIAAEFGLSLTGWDVDTHDWRGDSAAEMFAATQTGLAAGAVVLAHDGIGPGARRSDAAETARYVELVAEDARRRGITLGALTRAVPR